MGVLNGEGELVDTCIEMIDVVKQHSFDGLRWLGTALLASTMVADDEMLEVADEVGRHVRDAGLNTLDQGYAQRNVAEKTSLVGVSKTTRTLQFINFSQVVQHTSGEYQIAVYDSRIVMVVVVTDTQGEAAHAQDMFDEAAEIGVVVADRSGCGDKRPRYLRVVE